MHFSKRDFHKEFTFRKMLSVIFIFYMQDYILYERIHRNCSWLQSDLFWSNIITDSRYVYGFIRDGAFHFLLNCRLHIKQREALFNFLHHHNFRRDIRTLLFWDSKKDQAQNILRSKAVDIQNSRWLNEGTTPFSTLWVFFFVKGQVYNPPNKSQPLFCAKDQGFKS